MENPENLDRNPELISKDDTENKNPNLQELQDVLDTELGVQHSPEGFDMKNHGAFLAERYQAITPEVKMLADSGAAEEIVDKLAA